METKFKVALAQTQPALFDKDANLQKASAYIQQAAQAGASVVIFPELFLTGYMLAGRTQEMAEPLSGPSLERVTELARTNRIAVQMGFAELDPSDHKVYDSAFWISKSGKLEGCYRKTHLYGPENGWFSRGSIPACFETELGRVGVLICYDLEFPEPPRLLALNGAQWLAVSTANMKPNEHLQEIFIQSRASENRVWVAVCNRVGVEESVDFFGGSAVSSPFGEMIVQAGQTETLLLAEMDLSSAGQARLNADYLADRRPELYRGLS